MLRRGAAALVRRAPRRRASGVAAAFVAGSLRNGILQNDTLVTEGLPPPRYTLSGSAPALAELLAAHAGVDPFKLVGSELRSMSDAIREVIGSDVPALASVAGHLFETPGKRIRPTIVLLTAMASSEGGESVTPAQRRLSEIAELIHTASLLHDDVVDESSTRRGAPSAHARFGSSKLAILGGDFLLARASLALARLRNTDVVELLSQVIEHLVKGEVLQLRPGARSSDIQHYMTKTFLKTASLMANSCKAGAILGGHGEEVQDQLYEYGRHLGLTFQIRDDLLDCVGTASRTGKPVGQDLQSGLATLPVLFAAREHGELYAMIQRRFDREGDADLALDLVHRSDGIASAEALATEHAACAVAAASRLPDTPARSALIALVGRVLHREK